MTEPVMPLSLFLLDVATSFTDIDAPLGARALLEAFDHSGLTVSGFRFDEVEGGTRLTMMLPPLPGTGSEIVVPVPTLAWLSLVISAAQFAQDAQARPVIEFFEPFGEATYVELRDLRIALRLNLPLLRPAEGGTAVELAYRGGLRLSRQWGVTLAEDSGLELAPVEIAGSGIVLSARGIAADFRTDHNLSGLSALGLPDTFQGLYLRRGRVRLLPQSVFGSTPGLTVDFDDVAIGKVDDTVGVSARIRSYYPLALDGERIDPASGLVGHLLHPDWQIGLAAVELTLDRNAVRRFFIEGLLRVPPLQTVLRCNFSLEPRAGGGFVTRLAASAERPLTLQLGPGQLVLQSFQSSGTLGDTGFTLQGQLGGRLTLPGFALDIGWARLRLDHDAGHDHFEIELTDVPFGALGTVQQALLVVESTVPAQRGEDGASGADGEDGEAGAGGGIAAERTWRVQLRTALSWADLRARIDLGELPDRFPLPPDDASLIAELEWASAPATTLHLRLRAELREVDALWRGVPAAWRPRVDDATLDLVVDYADAAAFGAAAAGVGPGAGAGAGASAGGGGAASRFAGEVTAALLLRLPPLPADAPWSGLLALRTGDEQGRIRVRLRAAGQDVPALAFEIENPVGLAVQLPGLVQPQPPLQAELTRVGFALEGADAVEGRFEIGGRFTLHPLAPPPGLPLGTHLQALLQGLGLGAFSGELSAGLAFEGGRCALTLEGRFDGAEVALDVFDLIANLAQGMSGSEGLTGSPLDLDIGFGLRGVRLGLGSLDAAATAEQFSVELVVGLQLGGIGAEVFLRLSDRELAIGLAEDFPIPLEMPVFPVAPADLGALAAGAGGPWRVAPWDAELARLQQAADAEPERRARDALLARRFVLQGMRAVFDLLGSDANRTLYQTYCTATIGLLHGSTSALHVDTNLALVLAGRRRPDGSINPSPVQFRLPFADPRNIGVGGGARLTGFGPDDPLRVLEGLQLGLGLSADMLYFALDSVGPPIAIPSFGRYEGGTVSVSRIRFGYGYTRNSLAIELAGAVRLPDRLVEDADTTEQLGVGVRLPTHNALNFRLDLIPVTLGAVDFVVPLFAFDLDLRNPERAALADARRCLPQWDGLQFIVDGLYHDALRRVAFSPFFAMFPMPNLRFDGALSIGDERNGVQVVIDEMLVLFGLWTGGTPISVPLLAETMAPYVRNLCVNLNLAGFGIHFNVQRPFPSLSPLVLFEVLGLLADPMLPLDPRGELARSIRITLTEGRLRAPEEVVRMFPGLAGVIDKPVQAELNLGDAIAAMQTLVRAAQDAARALEQAGRSLERRVQALRRAPPRFDAASLLGLLPPQLRKFRVGGQLAGFEASAVLLLIDARDANALRAEFDRRSATAPAAAPPPTFQIGRATDDGTALRGWRPQLPRPAGTQVVDARDPRQSLLRGIEFEAFSAADLALLPPPPAGRTGIVIGAHVKLFTGQRLRFLGYLFDDVSFALIAAAAIQPLTLPVLGIAVRLPLALGTRLVLEGRQRRGGAFGAITGLGHADWHLLPGIARLRVASRARPARMSLRSDGSFSVDGSMQLDLFNGGARVDGEVQVDQTQCRVMGEMRYGLAGVFECRLQLQGRFGPGPHFRLEGDGSASLFGQALAQVRGHIDERSARLSARLDTGRWRVAGVEIDARVVFALDGEVDLARRAQPAFRLEGAGAVSLHGARVEGRGGIVRRNRRLNAFVEGALSWHGRRWLQGRIDAGDDGVRVAGRASFGVDLSPSNLGGVQLAHLFLRLDIGAEFALDAAAGLASYSIDGQWSLAALLPGEAGQAFPLAVQSLSAHGSAALDVELVHIRNMVRLPFGGIELPLPTLSSSTSSTLRFGQWDGDMAASWAGKRAKLIAGVLPWVESGSLSEAQTEHKVAIKTFTVGLDPDNTLTLDLPAGGDFRLALVWRNGGLALRVASGGQNWFRQL